MHKNSRQIFADYLLTMVPERGLKLAKARPGDFAIYRFGTSEVAVAVLRVIRAFGVRRFDGVIGIVPGDAIEPASRGQILFSNARTIHIFNIKALLDAAYIDEENVEGAISKFIDAVSEQFVILLAGNFEKGLDLASEALTVTPTP